MRQTCDLRIQRCLIRLSPLTRVGQKRGNFFFKEITIKGKLSYKADGLNFWSFFFFQMASSPKWRDGTNPLSLFRERSVTSPLVAKEKPKYQKPNANSLNRKGRGHLSDHIVEQLREDLGLRVSGTAESRHSFGQQSASLQSHLAIRPNLMTTQSLWVFFKGLEMCWRGP